MPYQVVVFGFYWGHGGLRSERGGVECDDKRRRGEDVSWNSCCDEPERAVMICQMNTLPKSDIDATTSGLKLKAPGLRPKLRIQYISVTIKSNVQQHGPLIPNP